MKQSDQSGFAAIEAILILVVVGILGFTGWFVWNAKHKTDTSLSNAANSQPAVQTKKATITPTETQAKLTSYTTKNHSVSFKYPSTWEVVDLSSAANNTDMITLKSSSGFSVDLSIDNTGHPGSDTPTIIAFTEPVKNASLGNGFLDYVTNNNKVTGVIYSQSATNAYDVFQFGGFNLFFHAQSKLPLTPAQAKTNADYQAAAAIAASLTLGA